MVYSVGLKLVVVGLDSVVGDAKVAVADFWISKLAVAIAALPLSGAKPPAVTFHCMNWLPC